MDGVTQFAEPIFHRGNGLPVREFKRSWATATGKPNARVGYSMTFAERARVGYSPLECRK
jgi:hypothetical protein